MGIAIHSNSTYSDQRKPTERNNVSGAWNQRLHKRELSHCRDWTCSFRLPLISSIERKGTLRRQRKIKQIQLGHKLDPPLPRNDDLTENCIHAISVKYIIHAVYSNERVMAPPQERGVILIARQLARHNKRCDPRLDYEELALRRILHQRAPCGTSGGYDPVRRATGWGGVESS